MAVEGLSQGGGGGAGAVSSVFTRTGAVTATAGDYTGVAVGGTADAVAASAITNAMVSASAAIAYSKLNLGTSILNADVSASAAIAISKLADPTTGKVIGSAASAAAAVFPPGYEINYTQITSPVSVASTTEATGTTIISPGAIVFDGTVVLLQVFFPYCNLPTQAVGNILTVNLFESTTQIGRLLQVDSQTTTTNGEMPLSGFYRFTPSAASHTYTITAYVNNTGGTPNLGAGSGGTNGFVPAFARFTKV